MSNGIDESEALVDDTRPWSFSDTTRLKSTSRLGVILVPFPVPLVGCPTPMLSLTCMKNRDVKGGGEQRVIA